jgi:hypothetical protein
MLAITKPAHPFPALAAQKTMLQTNLAVLRAQRGDTLLSV